MSATQINGIDFGIGTADCLGIGRPFYLSQKPTKRKGKNKP